VTQDLVKRPRVVLRIGEELKDEGLLSGQGCRRQLGDESVPPPDGLLERPERLNDSRRRRVTLDWGGQRLGEVGGHRIFITQTEARTIP
ncbi:hypothetical protein LCGC14_1846240, partial [marine sediment metagenome]